MEAVGIIAEYNPFHNGHLHHLLEAKKQSGAEAAVCVMSGNFTQRGEAALLDKWQRAELAVKCGLDLVIELPVVFALRSAQDFARGGVRLFSQLPAVKSLAFGTEHADLELLHKISAAAQAAATQLLLQENLKTGQPYAAALVHAIERQCGVSENILREPNTILSVEYLNAIKIFQSPLSPLPIERLISHYTDSKITAPLASAKAIRREMAAAVPNAALLASTVPPPVYEALHRLLRRPGQPPSTEYLATALLAKLRQMNCRQLQLLLGITEGLEHKFLQAALSATSWNELLGQVKSKRYPQSRLQRLALAILLDIDKKSAAAFDEAGPLYARVLAASQTGCCLLRELKKTASLPIITKTTDVLNTGRRASGSLSLLQQMLAYDTYASDLYALCFAKAQPAARDFTTSPFIAKDT